MKTRGKQLFRMKVKKPRQTYVHVSSDPEQQICEEKSFNSRFSSEYISLAKKFNIKMLGQMRRSGEQASVSLNKEDRGRVQTQFARSKDRSYDRKMIDPSPHSFQINGETTNRSSRSSKIAMFTLNRNTFYNGNYFKLRTEIDNLVFLNEQGIKLILSNGDNNLIFLSNHCKRLFSMREILLKSEINEKNLLREIKMYVLSKDGSQISRIDKCFESDIHKKQIKQLILFERMLLIAIVNLLINHHLLSMLEQVNRTLEMILGFWLQVIITTYNENIFKLQIEQKSDIKDIIKTLSDAKLLTKSNLKCLIDTLKQKIGKIFRHQRYFYKKIEYLISFSQDISINRSFYDLLTLFASFLTDFEVNHQINLDNFSFFATCPSPYLTKNSLKQYTLVLDLDQTLVRTSQISQKDKSQHFPEIQFRPGCCEFIQQMSQFFEIIIFTTSLQSYAKEITKKIKGISHCFYRQHAVRVKNGFIKDLARIGRDLKKTIIIDDIARNYRYQKDNGIAIKPWKGDPGDEELKRMKSILLNIIKKGGDVCQSLKESDLNMISQAKVEEQEKQQKQQTKNKQ